jgi:purine-binding chemotaxis protein CheW
METSESFLTFFIEGRMMALPLAVVDEVFAAVDITPLPNSPKVILGMINCRGRIIAVVDFRRRFDIPERAPKLSDRLILVHTPVRPLALLTDRVDTLIDIDGRDIIEADRIAPGTAPVDGVAKLRGDLLLIHDLVKFLSIDEETALSHALEETQPIP